MRDISLRLLLVTLLAALSPLRAAAWNKPGHMTTGAIAYRELKANDPQALARVLALLRQHPWFESEWEPAIGDLPTDDPDNPGLYLFMYAARWPDDVRDDPDEHCDQCHYINYPFKPSGQPASVQTQPPAQTNIISAFTRFRSAAGNSGRPAHERARALCWMFHLVGDVHQPLHTSTLFTQRFPQGDRGGTRFYVRARPGGGTKSLHSLWDGLIIGSERFRSVRNEATELRGRQEFRRSALHELSEPDFRDWAMVESFDLAKRVGYRNGALQGSTDRDDGAVVPGNYFDVVTPVAERRAVLAGYRLADLLSAMF